jgi:hypothetical protein
MISEELKTQILSLSDDQRAQVADFVAQLIEKNKPKIKERQIGGLKGAFIMAPDFDEPLEDFKDYM